MEQRGKAATQTRTSPSKTSLDSELEQFLQASRSITDNVREGLEMLTTEEEQLLKLRQQLGKIKRLREEQQQKDQLIQQLQERLAVLEHDKSTTGKQNSDLYVIMTERIHTLERYVQEKDSVERRLLDNIASMEGDLGQHRELQAQCEEAKAQLHQATVQLHQSNEEINNLKLQLQQEKHLQEHFHATIDGLTHERLSLEQATEQSKLEKHEEIKFLRDEIVSLKQMCEEARMKLRQSEQAKQAQELELFKTKHSLDLLQQDKAAIQRDYEGYQKTIHHETLHSVELKTTLSSMEFKYEQLQGEYSSEKQKSKAELGKLKSELRAIRESVSDELSTFCSAMEEVLQKDTSDVSNAGLQCWQRRLMSSMRAAMSTCEGQDLHLVVHQLCLLLQRVLQLQLHANNGVAERGSWRQQQQQRSKSSPSKAEVNEANVAAQQRLSQAFDAVSALLSQRMTSYHHYDTVFDIFVQLIQQHSSMLSLQVSSLDLELLSQNMGMHPSADLQAELYHQRRDKQLEVMLGCVQQVFGKVRETSQEKDLRQYLQDCQQELGNLHRKYTMDLQTLQRANDEAFLAVQVHSVEHEKTIDQLQVDAERKLAYQTEHYETQLLQKNEQLHEVCQAFDYLTVLLLYSLSASPGVGSTPTTPGQTSNASSSPSDSATENPLHFAYQISSKFAHGYEILLHDVKTLCQLSAMPTEDVLQQHCDSLTSTGSSVEDSIPAVLSLVDYMDNGMRSSVALELPSPDNSKRPTLRSVALMVLAAKRWVRLCSKTQRSQASLPTNFLTVASASNSSTRPASSSKVAVEEVVTAYLRSRALGVDGTSAMDRLHCFFSPQLLRSWKADDLALQLASTHSTDLVRQEVKKRVQDFVQQLASRCADVAATDLSHADHNKAKKASAGDIYVLSEHVHKRLHNRALFDVLTQSSEDGFVNMHFHRHPKTKAQIQASQKEQDKQRKQKELFAQYELNHLHKYIVNKALEQQETKLKMSSLHVLLTQMQADMESCRHSLEESMREKEKLREQLAQQQQHQYQPPAQRPPGTNTSTPERSFASKSTGLPVRGHSITPERRPLKEFPADMSLQDDSFTSSVAEAGMDWTRWSQNTSIYDQWSRASHEPHGAAHPAGSKANTSTASAKHQNILTSKDFRESLNSIYSATSATKPTTKSVEHTVFEAKKEPSSGVKRDQQELMEIYQDIGRLTRKLEDRLGESDHQQYMKHPGKASPSSASSPPQLSSATAMMMSSRRTAPSNTSVSANTSRAPAVAMSTNSAFASRTSRSANSSFSQYSKNI